MRGREKFWKRAAASEITEPSKIYGGLARASEEGC